jgi:hypothetical protein
MHLHWFILERFSPLQYIQGCSFKSCSTSRALSAVCRNGTPGWLWNLRPGTFVGPASSLRRDSRLTPRAPSGDSRLWSPTRNRRPAGRTPRPCFPPPDPRKRSLLYVGQPPQRPLTPRCGTGLPHKVAHVTCRGCPQGYSVPVTRTRARRKPMDKLGRATTRSLTLPDVTERHPGESSYPQAKSSSWKEPESTLSYPLST